MTTQYNLNDEVWVLYFTGPTIAEVRRIEINEEGIFYKLAIRDYFYEKFIKVEENNVYSTKDELLKIIL